MKKPLINKITLYLFTFICLSSFAQIHLGKDLSIKSIKEAINIAKDNDTIFINKGIYYEHSINVNKPLTIIGIDMPVIDGQKKGEMFMVNANNVTLKGMHIKGVGTSYTKDYAGIRVIKRKNYLIEDIVMTDLFFGIYLEKSRKGIVRNY